MVSLLSIGECMMELIDEGENTFARTYAGDTYNAAVYAKRYLASINVSMLTAVGTDFISDAMLAQFASEGIDCSLVGRCERALPGIYAIATDEQGERSFNYWRRNSAATQMITLLQCGDGFKALPAFDYVYFSGLSLAILNDNDKAGLLSMVQGLRKRGAKIVFDPNYRATMWSDVEHAQSWLQRAYQCTDIALPGLEDHIAVFKHDSEEAINDFLHKIGVTEVVVKSGESGVFGYSAGEQVAFCEYRPAGNQVDSTAAGDSFAGTYLALRIAGSDIAESISLSSQVARFVVQHRGAIVAKDEYSNFICELQAS